MSTIQTLIQKAVVGTLIFVFALVMTYIPQPFTQTVPEAEAAGVFGKVTDLYNGAINTGTMISTSMTAGSASVSANADVLQLSKNTTLDAVAWGLAKSILSDMTSSIVDWINNGFEGSPSFVQDLEGFLLNTADKEFGKYLEALGGPLSILCSPFKLDIRVALALEYQATRKGEGTTCTLTGVLENIENFELGGGSGPNQGWNDWFTVTTNPKQYTKYGSLLDVQAKATAKLMNARGDEITIAGFGNGFLSAKVCEYIEGANTTEEKCKISTPGKVIETALNNSLDSGRESLIQADEINEIIAALFGQLAKQVVTGAAGLLGLSDDTGYTTYTYDEFNATSSISSTVGTRTTVSEHDLGEKLRESVALEVDYHERALLALPILIAYAATSSDADEFRKSLARDEIARVQRIISELNGTDGLIPRLNRLIQRFNVLPIPEQDTPVTKKERQNIIKDFSLLRLNNKELVESNVLSWDRVTRRLDNAEEEQSLEEEGRGIVDDAVGSINSTIEDSAGN
jgi:hypothetical protein